MSHTVGSWEMILGTKCWQGGPVMLAEGALAARRPEKDPPPECRTARRTNKWRILRAAERRQGHTGLPLQTEGTLSLFSHAAFVTVKAEG